MDEIIKKKMIHPDGKPLVLEKEEDKDLKSYFDLIHKLDEKDQYNEPRCKFCKHKLRQEAEEVWEKYKRFNPVVEFFHKNGYPDMNMKCVRRHIRGHYMRQEQVIMRQHYADRLLPVINYKINKVKKIETYLAILEDKLWKYAAADHESPTEDRKNAELIVKILKEMGNLLKLQAELEGELKPVQIVIEKFQKIVIETINKIDDPKARMEIIGQLEAFRDLNFDG